MLRQAVLLGLVLGVGCSSDSGGDGGSGGGGGTCKALTNLCKLLPVTEVESACGSGYDVLTPVDTSGAGPVNSCAYQKNVSTADEYNVSVVYRCLEGVDAHEYFQGIVSQLQGQGENVAGVGDEAYFHSQGPNGEVLDVRQGQVVVAAQFSHPNPGTCTVDQAKAQAVLIAQKTLDLAK